MKVPDLDAYIVSVNPNMDSAWYIYTVPVRQNGKTYISSFDVHEAAVVKYGLSVITPDFKAKTICLYP